MAHSNCVCGDIWRFDACDIKTGRVKAVLHPISVDWEDPLSAPGQGSIMVAKRDLVSNDIWPHSTTVYISRVLSDGSRAGHFAGMLEKYNGATGGPEATIGMVGLDAYLFKRNIADVYGGLDYIKTNRQQTLIAKDLVDIGINSIENGGVPLTAIAETTTQLRDRTFRKWEYKNIGEAIQELVGVINGVEYQLEHTYDMGYWSTTMRFMDQVGEDRNIILRSDIEGSEYGVDVDAQDHATWVYGIGEGEELDQKVSVMYDESSPYPVFMAAPAWKDVKFQSTLDAHAAGYLISHRDPLAVPSMSIAGLDPDPAVLLSGDRVYVDISYGLVDFHGYARVLSQGWKLDAENPVTRVLSFQPEVRPYEGGIVKVPPPPSTTPAQTPITPPSTPQEPKAGLVCKIPNPPIPESSSLQISKAAPGYVYTSNDEVTSTGNTPKQIYIIKLSTGAIADSFNLSHTLPTDGDPESMRMDWTTGNIYLADIGDNAFKSPPGPRPPRTDIALYKFTDPGASSSDPRTSTKYPLEYPGGAQYNAEALLISPTVGMAKAFIITKETSAKARVFQLKNPLSTSSSTGSLIDTGKRLVNGGANLTGVSDGCITMNGKWALLRAAGVSDTLVYDLSNWQKVGSIPTPAMFQSESITVEADGKSFLVGSESSGSQDSPIYRVLIPTQFR